MFLNILKISVILSATSVAWAYISLHVTQDFEQATGTYSSFETVGDRMYYFSKDKLTWYKAFLACRLMDSFLASPYSSNHKTPLFAHIASTYPSDNSSYWLSGSDLHKKNNFLWYGMSEKLTAGDISAIQSQSDSNESSGHCIILSNQYELKSWPCDGEAHYICQAEKATAVLLSLY